MEESLAEMIDCLEPGESGKIEGLEQLRLETKYVPALEPNPALIRLLYRKVSNPSEPAKASLCILHGFGEHSGKYLRSAAVFALRGYEVHLIDQRNAGLSGGPKGHGNLIEFAKDANKLMQMARPDLPCYLWGHSQGGLLATYFIQLNPYIRLAGLIISNPLYSLARPIPAIMKQVLPVLIQYFPIMLLNGLVVTGNITRTDSYLYRIFEDKVSFPFIGMEHAASMFQMQDVVVREGKALLCPFLLFHSKKDMITSCEVSTKFFQSVASPDKELRISEEGYHEPHHEPDKDKFTADILSWMDARLEKAKPLSIIGTARTVKAVTAGSGWPKRLLLLLVLVYIVVALRFKSTMAAGVVRFFAYTLLPKALWPVFLVAGLIKR